MTRRAFTLLEILIVVVILGGLIVVVFAVFAVGVSGFKLGTVRLDLQSELRRIINPLRQDLRNSSFQSTSFVSVNRNVPANPPDAQPVTPVHRDGLCFNGLKHVLDDASYDQSGFPKWDCYVVYFASLDEPDGKMVRLTLRDDDVPPDDVLSIPRTLAAGDLSLTNPELLDGNVRILSNQVMDFEVSTDQGNQLVHLRLRLRGKAGHQDMGRRSIAEVLEINTAVRPANTWPRL
ncbi:type II secretion system protein [bacterium]|nr:type II secretion system protein [bacterium]